MFRRIPALLWLAGFLFAAGPLAAQVVNINDTLQRWGFTREAQRVPGATRWKNQWSHIELERDKAYLTLNGVRVWMGAPVREQSGVYYLQRHDFERTLLPIVSPQPSSTVQRVRHVLLDPGHGGKDTGGRNPHLGLDEKAVAFDVARRVKFILEQRGLKVTLTRTRDVFIELSERALMARKVGADVFVSIHFNTAPGAAGANGIETYVLTPQGQYSTNDGRRAASSTELNAREIGHKNDAWNTLLGYHLQANMLNKIGGEDRGLRRARFRVLQDVACPGALVECGFLSNPSEGALIATGTHREKIAQGIADGILKYQQIVERLASQPASRR